MFRILILSIGINILLIGSVFSQNSAPTLQAGLGGVTFNKGSLDTEVIAKLIAEKQEELKLQLIQSMLLSDLDKAGGVIYSYANDLLNTVLSGSSLQIKTKNITESTVNVAVVLAFVNHYVGVIGSDELENLNQLAKSLGVVDTTDNSIKDKPIESLVDLIQNLSNKTNNDLSVNDGKVRSSKYKDEQLIKLVSYLIDITAVALEENEILKERGLFRFMESNLNRSKNVYLNKSLTSLKKDLKEVNKKIEKTINDIDNYQRSSIRTKYVEELNVTREKYEEQKKAIESDICIAKIADAIFKDVEKYVDEYVRAFGVFDFIYRNELDIKRIDTVFANALDTLASEIDSTDKVPDISMNNLDIENYLKLVKHLRNIMDEISEQDRDEFEQFFKKMESYLIKKKLKGENCLQKMEQVYLIGNELLPVVQRMVVLAGDTTSIEKVFQQMELKLVSTTITTLLDSLNITPKHTDDFQNFYELFGAIQNLDDIDSYETFFKNFYLTLDVFVDGKMKSTLETIVNLTSNHMEFVKTDSADYVNVDVEGILVSLSDMNYDRFRWLKFYLTVGGNTMYFLKEDQTLGGNKVDNFQYFGEKIGVKIKLYDWAYLRSFSPGETFSYWGYSYIRKAPPYKPIVSDVHLLAYGSGLLYNIAGTSSNTSIDNALWGIGLGLSFYNNLDLNISRGYLFGVSDAKPFWNIGFDIRFTEYIKALSKK